MESSKKALNSSNRINRVSNHSAEENGVVVACEDNEAYSNNNRESIAPIISASNEDAQQESLSYGENQEVQELDIVEQLRMESVDIRINPVGMRRVIFRLQTSYKTARKQQQNQARQAAAKSGEKELPLSKECSICLADFENYD